jgi:hypothetical protein
MEAVSILSYLLYNVILLMIYHWIFSYTRKFYGATSNEVYEQSIEKDAYRVVKFAEFENISHSSHVCVTYDINTGYFELKNFKRSPVNISIRFNVGLLERVNVSGEVITASARIKIIEINAISTLDMEQVNFTNSLCRNFVIGDKSTSSEGVELKAIKPHSIYKIAVYLTADDDIILKTTNRQLVIQEH